MKRAAQSKPITTKSSVIKYQNSWITVHEDEVTYSNGRGGVFGVVDYGVGVAILPIDDDGNVYLVKEYKYALGDWSLEVAAGGVEVGENLEATARRELKEELGITADRWTYLGAVWPFTTIIRHAEHQFIAQGLHFGSSKLEDTERIKLVKMPIEEAHELIKTGKIVNAVAVALILRAMLMNLQGRSLQRPSTIIDGRSTPAT
jgi:8-oxo-dGTP pyrophosphatase MutT (NUDIX family)